MVLKVNAEEAKQIDVDLPNVPTITTADAAIAVPGVKAGELYLVAFDLAALDVGLLVQSIAHATEDVLTVRLVNPTIAAINPAPGIEMTYIKL